MTAETAANQLRRVLQLIPLLGDGERHGVNEVAAQLGVGRRELLNDLISLTERSDEPGGFVDGVQLLWDDEHVSALTERFLRPMRLTRRELCALELGLGVLRRERPPEEWPPIERALEQVRAMITRVPANDRLDDVFAADTSAPGDEHLPVISAAVRRRRKLALDYRGAAASESSHRIVCPYGLVAASGMTYLVGHCDESDGLRVFRLDRIENVAATDEPFARPADFSVDAVLRDGRVFQGTSAPPMRVRYGPRVARWIAEREGRPVDADGSLTVEYPVADPRWAVRHVLRYGAEAEILEPEELRLDVLRAVDAMAAATTPPPPA